MLAAAALRNFGRSSMARKKRQLPGGKRKKSKATTGKPARRRSKTRRLRKRRPRSLRSKVKGAYRVVVDTIKGTDQLRNKMEPPATSETE
jgi:hypothetical protein